MSTHSRGDVVLVHGASGNAATWDLRPWGWAQPVAVDLPGRGDSPGSACQRVGDTAAWLARNLASKGLDKPVVVGHSYGGAVGLQLALDHPGALGALVMVSSASRLKVAPAILEAVASSSPDAAYRLDAAFGPTAKAEVVDRYARDSSSVPPQTALSDWRACDAFDVRDRLGEVGVPTLVVYGDADFLTAPKYQRRLVDAIPGASSVVLPGIGHMLPWEAPSELSAAVRRFLG